MSETMVDNRGETERRKGGSEGVSGGDGGEEKRMGAVKWARSGEQGAAEVMEGGLYIVASME